MQGIDFRLPYIWMGIQIVPVGSPQDHRYIEVKNEVMLPWEHIYGMERFEGPSASMFVENQESKTKIWFNVTGQCFVALIPFEEASEMWNEFKLWKAKSNVFKNN